MKRFKPVGKLMLVFFFNNNCFGSVFYEHKILATIILIGIIAIILAICFYTYKKTKKKEKV